MPNEKFSEGLPAGKRPDKFQAKSLRRAWRGLAVVLVVGLALDALLLAPRCPSQTPEYTVIPTDERGPLEYCVAEAIGMGTLSRQNVVHAGAACGQNKATLRVLADRMTKKAENDVQVCNTHFLANWLARFRAQLSLS